MNPGLQQNNYSPMGQGQPQTGKRGKKQNFMTQTMGMDPLVEPPAPGIPAAQIGATQQAPSAGGAVNNTMPIGNDPRAYIQSLLPQGPASPQALAGIEGQLNQHGITLQKNSNGDIRGRAYLPNPGGFQYSNAVDLVGQWGQPWTYTERRDDGSGSIPKKAPANQMYQYFQSQLQPQQQQDSADQLLMLLQALQQGFI